MQTKYKQSKYKVYYMQTSTYIYEMQLLIANELSTVIVDSNNNIKHTMIIYSNENATYLIQFYFFIFV